MTNPARTAAERAPGDTSANIGSIRVAMTGLLLAAIAFFVGIFTGETVDVSDPRVLAVTPVVFGGLYRVSRALAARWPRLAPVLFVVPDAPVYESPATPLDVPR